MITGASGGIGGALARHFARLGSRLALADVNEQALTELAGELQESGTDVSTHTIDVRDETSMSHWVKAVEAEFGRADVLINNAGLTNFTPFEDQALRDIHRLMDVNVRGVMLGCHMFLPLLRRSKCGHIVNMSSMIAFAAAPMQSTYTASKWAIRGFSQARRMELRDQSIGVTAVMPGTIATPFLSRAESADNIGTARMSELMLRFGTSPQRVAKKITKAIDRNQGELRIGWDSYLVSFLQWILPGFIDMIVRFAYRRYLRKTTPADKKSSQDEAKL